MELLDYQWELGGVVFGIDCPVDHETDVAPPPLGWRTDDQPNPGGDGINMGADYIDPASWSFKLFTNCQNETDALAALMDLRKAWRGDAYRKEPGKATTLRYRLAGRTRVVFGRPRRFEHPWGAEYLYGKIPITADFQTVSDLFYDDFENWIDVTFREPTTGGFVTPVTAPLQTAETGLSNGPFVFAVGGEQATSTMVDFVGPLDAPGLEIDGEPYIQLKKDVPAGVTVTVDARPWVNSVLRSDGGGAAGMLSPRSRMPKMLLEPGSHSATLLGSTPTGTGKAKIRWRPAYPSV